MDYQPSTNSIERSLLQKAVRRGNTEIIEKVLHYLKDDLPWLRRRLQLIAYEECWPITHTINPYDKPYQIFKEYKRLAVSVKNNNASGLADLAINKTEWPPF